MAPIRKILVAALAGGIIYLGSLLGIELSSEEAQGAAQYLVPLLLAYWVPDPQVDTGR